MKPIRRPCHPSLLDCIRRSGAHAGNPPAPHGLRAATGVVLALAALGSDRSSAAIHTWQGGNIAWVDGGNIANWNPNGNPDSNDDVVFNSSNNVTLGSNNSILSLTMAGGISLSTSGFDLSINGLLVLSGSGTDLTIGGAGSAVNADFVNLTGGAQIILDGGTLAMSEESGTGLIDTNSGTTLSGTGAINLLDAGLAGPTNLMTNDGTISAAASPSLGSPPAGTLAINAADANARVNLDGGGSTAVVNVFRNQTLDLNVAQLDPYSASLNLFHQSVFDSAAAWSIDSGAAITVDNGQIPNPLIPALTVPSGTGFIRGAAFTQSGGTITVTDNDGALQFDAPFTMNGGNLVNNGDVIFNANATIASAASFTMPTTSSSLTVSPGVVVNVDQVNYDADGSASETNVITIGSGGILDLDLGAGADENLDGTILLNGGELDVTTLDNTWSINGSVILGADTGTSQINGEALTFTGAQVTVGAGSVLDVNAAHTWGSGTNLNIGTGATAELSNATFNSPGSITGAGTLRCLFNSTVAGSTTINVNLFDWDGSATVSTYTINPGAVLTVNSPIFDGDGDMDDAVILGGNGGGIVFNGPATWKMHNTLSANNGNVGLSTIGGTSRMILETAAGILNVNGNTEISAPVTFGA